MKKPALVVVGAGSRGAEAYGSLVASGAVEATIVAVVEPDSARRKAFADRHAIGEALAFADWRDFLARGRIADALLICSPDSFHFEQASAALAAGYHVLLEKPLSNDPRECLTLGDLANGGDRVFMVCHVLRYSPFFAAIKRLVGDGAIGELMAIQHNENVGYWHFAHSFVRGNWRSARGGSPLVLAKSCHDMDLLLWLAGRDCLRLASFGSLRHFTASTAPEGSGTRCAIDCSIEGDCPYSARKIYPERRGGWPSTVISLGQTEADVAEALASGPYGRCVYRCDNDVVDHQSTILEFEGGVSATFGLCAFTGEISRTLRLMGSRGEIRGDFLGNEIELARHGSAEKRLIRPAGGEGNHGGGDLGLLRDFVGALASGSTAAALTGAAAAVQGHLMAFAAEKARVESRVVELGDYLRSLRSPAS